MKKRDIEKNRLDLSYQRNLQLLNAVLFIGGGSFVAYLAALILGLSKFLEYTLILVVLGIIILFTYKKINDNLKNISDELKQLADK